MYFVYKGQTFGMPPMANSKIAKQFNDVFFESEENEKKNLAEKFKLSYFSRFRANQTY